MLRRIRPIRQVWQAHRRPFDQLRTGRGKSSKRRKLRNEPNSMHAGLAFCNWLWENEANCRIRQRRRFRREPGLRENAFLPNEANVLEYCGFWISLVDKVLEAQLCHFVAWLRFAKIGFVWGCSDDLSPLWDGNIGSDWVRSVGGWPDCGVGPLAHRLNGGKLYA